MISLRHRTSFVLHQRATGGAYHLMCRVMWDGCRSQVSLNVGYEITPEKWEQRTAQCLPHSFHGEAKVPAATINREILRFRETADEVFDDFAEQDIWPDAAQVRSALRTALGFEAPSDADAPVGILYTRFVQENAAARSWTRTMRQKMSTLKRHMDRFGGFQRMRDFTEKNLTGFITHLRAVPMCDTTVDKSWHMLKIFLRWADARELIPTPEWKTFSPKLKESSRPVIFLTWEELMRLWEWEAPRQSLAQVRDIFCLCAFTSLRFSDAMNLQWADVSDDALTVTSIKTGDKLVIDLNKWSREIIDRYRGRGEYVLPRISNQKANEHVKEFGRMLGFDAPVRIVRYRNAIREDIVQPKYELLGTHAARRTFICNALMMGIAPSVVMQWTGHSDYDSMKPYIAIADRARKNAMSLFDQKA